MKRLTSSSSIAWHVEVDLSGVPDLGHILRVRQVGRRETERAVARRDFREQGLLVAQQLREVEGLLKGVLVVVEGRVLVEAQGLEEVLQRGGHLGLDLLDHGVKGLEPGVDIGYRQTIAESLEIESELGVDRFDRLSPPVPGQNVGKQRGPDVHDRRGGGRIGHGSQRGGFLGDVEDVADVVL